MLDKYTGPPKTQNNFAVLVDDTDPNNIFLKIAIKETTEFVPIWQTAFVVHPKCPAFYHDFPDYESAAQTKLKWEKFLATYLNK